MLYDNDNDSDNDNLSLITLIAALTPSALTTVHMYDHSVCDQKSVIEELVLNTTFQCQFTCNGQQAYWFPWSYSVMIDGQQKTLVIERHAEIGSFLNGIT